MFASFSLFWSAVPLELAFHYHLSQSQIALFALVGATGAIAAPISGRLADAGHTRVATRYALILGSLAMFMTLFSSGMSIVGLALAGVLLDFCVQMNIVLGQRAIYALDAASRSRLNGLYMTGIFIGGAIGSALASSLYAEGGWAWIAMAAGSFPLLALARFFLKTNRD
jgi:predicted MFS family arabinose efflux permease